MYTQSVTIALHVFDIVCTAYINSLLLLYIFPNQDDKYDYTIIAMNPGHMPKPTSGEERIRFPLNAYEDLGDSQLKVNDNVYLVHYPSMDGDCVLRESAYLVQYSTGKNVNYTYFSFMTSFFYCYKHSHVFVSVGYYP